MMRAVRFSQLLLAVLCLAFTLSCSSSPTGVTLGEAFTETMRPNNGDWSGGTSQSQPVTFSVISNGMQIASNFQFAILIDESWGSGALSLYTTISLDIRNRAFSLSSNGIVLTGSFTSPTQCHGTLSINGYVSFDGTNYHYVSHSYTWTASLTGSGSAQLSPGLRRHPMIYRAGRTDSQPAISICPVADK